MAKKDKEFDELENLDEAEVLAGGALDDADAPVEAGAGRESGGILPSRDSRPGRAKDLKGGRLADEEVEGEPELRRSEGKRYTQLSDRNRCRFTRAGVERIDYKDVVTLQKLMTAQAKLMSRKRTGIAARYQRMVKLAIKRARFMALLPYVG